MNLYAHQKRIIDEDPQKTVLFLGTGSGKTRIALMLAQGSTLVICPKTQKEDGNWEREWETIVQTRAAEASRWPRIKHLTVVSKETFRRDHEHIQRYDTVIVDEAHTVLGLTPNTRQRKKQTVPKASQLFEALQEYVERTKPTRLYLATATIMKSPMTVLAAKWILTGEHSINEFYQFRHQFYTKLSMPGREVWVPKKDSDTKDKLAAMVRSLGYVGRLSDYFDVPAQQYLDVYVELTQKQKDRIKELKMEFAEPIVRLGKTLQVENGLLSGDEFTKLESFENAKLEKILDYAIEFPQMIVFSRFLSQIDQIRIALEKIGKKVFVMTGDVKDRGAVIAEVNACEDYVFIVSAQISAGWEVPNCPVMVFASRTYSWVDLDQAQGRILRANALKKNLFINLVVRNGIDEAVHKSLINKTDFSERVYLGV